MKKNLRAAVYDTILQRAPLETDARSALSRLIALQERDPALNMQFFTAHLYPFVTHTLSAPQSILLRHLSDFKGELLAESYREATVRSWKGPSDRQEVIETASYYLESILRVSESIGRRPINSAQLAFALTIFNLSEVRHPVRGYSLSGEELRRVVAFEYTQGNEFWEDHGISLDQMVHLSEDLLSFDGTAVLTPEEVRSRFCLSMTATPGGIQVIPVERWGVHRVGPGVEEACAELLLPTRILIQPDELASFEDLLDSESATEIDWQRFFDRHPSFIYLLGDYEDHRREITLAPEVLFSADESTRDLRPDFLLKRIALPQWDILEVKLPRARLAVGRPSRRRLSGAVQEASSQLREYRDFFRDRRNLAWFRDYLGPQLGEPRMHLLIGRDAWFSSPHEKVKLAGGGDISIFTYDDLHRIATHSSIR